MATPLEARPVWDDGGALAIGAISLVLLHCFGPTSPFRRRKPTPLYNSDGTRIERALNKPDLGPLGLGILQAIKGTLKRAYLRRYLHKFFFEPGLAPGLVSNSAIAHASEDPIMDTLNVAMPDLTGTR